MNILRFCLLCIIIPIRCRDADSYSANSDVRSSSDLHLFLAERERERETDRQTDRQTGRQAGRQTDRQIDTDRQTDTDTDTDRHRQTDRDRQTGERGDIL